MEAPTIQTKRLIIRPFRNSDLDALVEDLMSQADIMVNLSEKCETPSEQRTCASDYIDGYSSYWQTHHYGGWAVCARIDELAEPGRLLGYCGFGPEQLEGEGAELAYAYGRAHWRKGIGTEAGRACLDWYFTVAGYERCYSCHHSWNDASRKIIEKLGFVHSRDEDLWGSVEKGHGLLPTYLLDRSAYLNITPPSVSY